MYRTNERSKTDIFESAGFDIRNVLKVDYVKKKICAIQSDFHVWEPGGTVVKGLHRS